MYDEVKVTTVTLSDVGVALIVLDQERRNKISALNRVKRQISDLDELRHQYSRELSECESAIERLMANGNYSTYGYEG